MSNGVYRNLNFSFTLKNNLSTTDEVDNGFGAMTNNDSDSKEEQKISISNENQVHQLSIINVEDLNWVIFILI